METKSVTTTFVEDAPLASTLLETKPIGHDLNYGGETIQQFLEKPILLYSGVWTAAMAVSNSILPITTGIGLDSQLLTNPMFAEKVKGFSMNRADVRIKLQINATPFHQGQLLMSFLPMSGAMSLVSPSYAAMHNYNNTTRYMLPHVEFDTNMTTVEMEIPYITPANYYGLATTGSSGFPTYNRGAVDITVMSPLRTGTGGVDRVEYAVFISFSNVELAAPMVPQSSLQMKKGKTRKFTRNVPEIELESMKSKPISSALSTAGTIARSLAAVPVLAPVMEPASWVADGLAGIASFFGYSKPQLNMAPTLVTSQFNRYAAVSDGTDSAYPLALRSDNSVTKIDAKTPYVGDEMSFTFLKGVVSIVDQVSWNTSQPDNTVLFTKNMSPASLFRTSSFTKGSKSATLMTGPPIWYLSNLFTYWRGGIKVIIKVVKTNFHSGRLQLTWTPRPGASPPTVFTAHYSIREIVDVRVGDIIEMELPYLLPMDYVRMDDSSGVFEIRVLNALKAPESVSNTVDLLMYYSGSADMEFAVPGTRPGIANMPPFSPEMYNGESSESSEQSIRAGPTILTNQIPGTIEPGKVTTSSAEHCVGEMFSSVRQLLLRYNQIWQSSPVTGTGLSIWPYFTSVTRLDATSGIVGGNAGGDVQSFISAMYAFYRGGMKVQIHDTTGPKSVAACINPRAAAGNNNVITTTTISNGLPTAVAWTTMPTTTIATGTVVTDSTLSVTAFSVPYYSRAPVSLNIPMTSGQLPSVSGSVEISQAQSGLVVQGYSDVTKCVIYRSIAEDFQYQFFVGCPPLVATTVGYADDPTAEELFLPGIGPYNLTEDVSSLYPSVEAVVVSADGVFSPSDSLQPTNVYPS